jgi:hypothetical protein
MTSRLWRNGIPLEALHFCHCHVPDTSITLAMAVGQRTNLLLRFDRSNGIVPLSRCIHPTESLFSTVS